MRKFYALAVRFSNVEDIYVFDTKIERDEYVRVRFTVKAITYRQVLKRLAANRRETRTMRRCDSGWYAGLPTCMEDLRPQYTQHMRE